MSFFSFKGLLSHLVGVLLLYSVVFSLVISLLYLITQLSYCGCFVALKSNYHYWCHGHLANHADLLLLDAQ